MTDPIRIAHYFQTLAQTADSWGVTRQRVLKLLAQRRIPEAQFFGGIWLFPRELQKPEARPRWRQPETPAPYVSIEQLARYIAENARD